MGFNTNIVLRSAPRSGSTFIAQIFKMLFQRVDGGHTFNANANVVVFRNFLDAGVSLFRISNDLDPDFIITDKKDIDWIFKHYNQYVSYTVNYTNNRDKRLFFVYDFDIKSDNGNDYNTIFSKIENFFNVKITEEEKNNIINNTNIAVNKKRSEQFNTFYKWDKETLIHGRHVDTGEIGIWKRHVSEDLHKYYENSYIGVEYNKIIKKLGY